MAHHYSSKKVRALCDEVFTFEELICLCYDLPDAKPIYSLFKGPLNKQSVIDQLVNQTAQSSQVEFILAKAKSLYPEQYNKHHSYEEDEMRSPWLIVIATSVTGIILCLCIILALFVFNPDFMEVVITAVLGTNTPTPTSTVILSDSPQPPASPPTEVVPDVTLQVLGTASPTLSPIPRQTETSPPILPTDTPEFVSPTATPKIIPTDTHTPMPPIIEPLGGAIIFHSICDGNWEIYGINADGSNRRRITTNTVSDIWPVWSPDGAQIAFQSKREGDNKEEIYVMNADGSNQENLTNNVRGDDNFPDWSSNSSQIVFVSNRDGNQEIYVMSTDGTNQTRITDNLVDDRWPDWSPDGSQIAFVSNRDGNFEIYVMNTDGSNQRRLTETAYDEGHPVWSPDGKYIAFQVNDGHRGFDWNIYRMNSDGSNKFSLTKGSNNIAPVWSPNGKYIAFNHTRSPIQLVKSDGSEDPSPISSGLDNCDELDNNPSDWGVITLSLPPSPTPTPTDTPSPQASNPECHEPAYALWLDGKVDLAMEAFNEVIELDPGCAFAYLYRGVIYHYQGNYDQAIADKTKATELKSDHADCYRSRGLSYAKRGQISTTNGQNADANEDYQLAIDDYTKAIETYKPFDWAYIDRGDVYRIIGDDDLALADYCTAFELKRDDRAVTAAKQRLEQWGKNCQDIETTQGEGG